MKLLRIAERREVITSYLERERRRRPDVEIDTDELSYDDCNKMDQWLMKRSLKYGVMTGFRQWAWTTLNWDDLLECAVHDRLSDGQAERSLGALWRSGFLRDWEPIMPNPDWHELIRAGLALPTSQALIIRPAVPSELARYYVEDGTGRAAYLVAHRPAAEVVAYAYVGFDPDPSSRWLHQALDEGHFVRTAGRYRRIENILPA